MNSVQPYPLQSLSWPDASCCTEERLFIHGIEGGQAQLGQRLLQLRPFGSANLMTYFNAFHLTRWRQVNRKITPRFEVMGEGALTLRWMRLDGRGQEHPLGDVSLQLVANEWAGVAIPGITPDSDGFLAPVLIASDQGCTIKEARYVTDAQPLRRCRLGLVITHFNRHAQVQGAIERLHELTGDPAYQGKIVLKVIDNSQDLRPVDKPGIDIIPNRNLGGSGGFARGLLELEKEGTFTHCLFMDDDASCPQEAIRRTLAVFEMADDAATALAGAMMRADDPCVMHENGAKFTGGCRSIHNGLNIGSTQNLAQTDALPSIDYGAWWYFAFPIAQVKHYPYPFFVRGDDISFGLANPFHIITLNGVCSWQDSFEEKASPLTNYLDMRNHLVHLLTGHVKDGQQELGNVLKTFVTRRRDAMLYESAEAALLAIEDVLQGPDFWKENLDMRERRQRIGNMTVSERMREITDAEVAKSVHRTHPRSLRNKLAYHLSLKGLLLPRALLRQQPALTRKTFAADRYALFRFTQALYLSSQRQAGFVAEFDKRRFLSIMARTVKLKRKLNARFACLSADYVRGYEDLTSRAFWRSVYEPDTVRENPVAYNPRAQNRRQ